MADLVRFEAGDVMAAIDVACGARLASLSFGGRELLVTDGPDPMLWGCYPMVPWAGRVADGRFELDGTEHRLPIGLAPHAIHGTAYTRPWAQVADGRFRLELVDDWPFGGAVEHSVALAADRLQLVLEVEAGDRAMPAMAGWHPWFRRAVDGSVVQLDFEAEAMYERDDRHLPTGWLVAPTAGPWDDCFVGVKSGPTLRWPDVAALGMSSSCDHWVVYDEPDHAVCVEPQTGPPDEFNSAPRVLDPGGVLRAELTMTLTSGAG